jgi:excisionase family DNA binding protein
MDNKDFQPRITLSIAEVAARLGVNPATIRLEIGRGRLKATRLARRVLVRVADLERYLAAREIGGDGEARR